jgi:hypothetical protein
MLANMSDSPKGGGSNIGASPLTVIVKGGTSTSAYDKDRAMREHQSELGRKHQAKQEESARLGPGMTKDGFVHSKLTSLRMMDSGSPRVVFAYLNKDKSVRQHGVGEVVVTGDGDMLFTMVCPKCLERGESHGASQVMVKNSHRKWYLDTRKQGTMVELRDPDGVPFYVKICGTVYVDDIIRCTNVNCTWAVRIADSKVEEA